MEIPVHQRNTKFVNNLPSYWGKYVTIVKNNKDISTVSYVHLYAHLKSYEKHALKTLSKMNQTFGNADPLAYMAKFKDKALLMEAKEKGVILDAETEAFLADVECTTPYSEPLAITTTTAFEVIHEDAYDSDFDETPHAAVAFMANLMQTGPSTGQGTSNDTDFHSEVQTYDNHFFHNMHLQVSQEIHTGEQLDSDVDSVIDDHDNTILYHQYQLNNKVESVLTDVSSVIPGEISMITILNDLRSQLEGHIKTNKEQSFANDSLKAELERYKTQVQNLEQKSEKLKADKNALEESYLEELVWLRNTNKVVMELLQSYGQPVQTVPMLSKRPTFSTKDLYKSALGHRNPLVYDSEETLVQAGVSRTKMLERMKDPLCKVSSKPINYAKLNSMYDTFVPQKQLSREQDYWLPANEVASYNCNQSKPVTNFVRTRPTKSQVYTQLKMLKTCFPEFDKVVKDRTIPSYITNEEWHFKHTKKCFVEEIILFYEKLKTHVKGIEDNIFKEVSEYMKIFNELDKEYDQCVIDKKSLEIENKNLLIQNECLLAESVSKDICSVVLTSDIAVPISVEPRSNCVKEHFRNLELEAEILKVCNTSSSPELNVFFEINKLKDQLQGKDELIRKLKAQIGNMKEVSADFNLRIKSVTKASKLKSKCETKTHRNLPARSENVKRVDNPLRSLNKRNRVDSSLSVKRTRKITLGDTCPLTRITKPEVVPLEKSGSVSTSEPANNVIVTPRFSKKPLTSYKHKDKKLKDISTSSPPNTETKVVNDPVNVNDLSANQLDPNKNWVSDVPNSTTSLVFHCRSYISSFGNAHKGFLDSSMETTDKESSAAGTDNRPPMLEESDFESWKIRIESPHPMITVTTGEGEQQTQVTREKTDEEFTEAKNNKERADIQATNILSQGLPRHIFNILNQTETAKEI
ncbi:hypothetical protein Tco_0302955 [Tanacetum coccineum]